ncbi:MAG: phage tail assembly protein [Chloroflexota bacterium]|nr:phage tail assembly protein [Chloroflexota bacterium]MDE2844019.1 phage tail assembly protein [Chloroflexota bacterium]
MLRTEHEFTLPKGYVDREGTVHRTGVMRLATAMDEITPMRDARVKNNEAYLTIIILSRVITQLGSVKDVNTGVIENMFTADLTYLQEFYRSINEGGDSLGLVACPSCETEFEVQPGELMALVEA